MKHKNKNGTSMFGKYYVVIKETRVPVSGPDTYEEAKSLKDVLDFYNNSELHEVVHCLNVFFPNGTGCAKPSIASVPVGKNHDSIASPCFSSIVLGLSILALAFSLVALLIKCIA